MKIGVSAFAWTKRPNETHLELLPKLREHGLEGFEIPMFDPADIVAPRLRRAIEKYNLDCTVCAILPDGINPISEDPVVRKRSLDHLLECIETSAEAGAHLIGGPLFAPIGYLPGRRRSSDEWHWAVECFRALTVTLDSYEMTLCIEPVNRSETFFLNRGAEARAFCEAVDHPRIGITIDTFHANIEEKSIPDTIGSLGKVLKHLHASENDRGLLGSGHIDFPAIIRALKTIEYDGYLMIEGFGYSPNESHSLGALWGDLNVTPEKIAFEGAKYLRHVLEAPNAG
jgi:D-psicose/D-tagatose/L-ribulose 3-epimerase